MRALGQLPSSDCDRIRGLVSAALDGELSEVEGVGLEAHLALCADCRTYAAETQLATRMMRETPLQELDFPISLPSRRLAVARRLQVGAAAAALVVMVGLSTVVGSVGTRSSTPGASAGFGAAPSAKLRSTEDELRMLYRASSSVREGLKVHGRMTL